MIEIWKGVSYGKKGDKSGREEGVEDGTRQGEERQTPNSSSETKACNTICTKLYIPASLD